MSHPFSMRKYLEFFIIILYQGVFLIRLCMIRPAICHSLGYKLKGKLVSLKPRKRPYFGGRANKFGQYFIKNEARVIILVSKYYYFPQESGSADRFSKRLTSRLSEVKRSP